MLAYLISFISGMYVAQTYKECPNVNYWFKYFLQSIQKIEEKKEIREKYSNRKKN